MPIQILMPALSPTMTEGNLTRWLKKEGDMVKAGQVIAEIETDKATMEVEAVDEGKLVKILIQGGSQGIKVNTAIAVLVEEGENLTAEAAMKLIANKNAPTPGTSAKASSQTVETSLQTAAKSSHAPASGSRVIISPLAKRIAEENKIDVRTLQGTGPHGRIIKVDVDKAKASGSSTRSGASAGFALPQGIDARDYADKLGMPYEALTNTAVRKVIARRLTESKQLVPHFYLAIDCDIDALLALRKSLNEIKSCKVSVNDCVIRAVALALRKVPAANVSWTDQAILQYKNIDVSVAVASPNGLITPIIKQADTKDLVQISTEMKDLASRARDGKLRPEEFQGGGFSVSNLGMFGVKEFSAIINPPQSCILAVGAGEQRAVVKNGQLAIATVMTCTLSVDHRAVDGSVGAEFLAAFKPLIENPISLVV